MNSTRASAVLGLIGNTPAAHLHFEPEGVSLYAKCEFLNPSGSVKDRLAKCVLLDAERRGVLRPDSIILECTSGNTGIALSMVGAAMGYRVTILMSSNASGERRRLIRQLGAELILFDSGGMYQTGIELSRQMAADNERYFLPRQFENPLNVNDHERTTGQEILGQLNREFGLLVGTSSGANVVAALKLAAELGPQATIVTLLSDRAERYFSTALFDLAGREREPMAVCNSAS